ncbi:MAG: hypothetical protein FJ295_00540 [Planctomycetes bacterium]|nr:hypothetical protein [Planctomycetota bacterium]
MRQAGGVERFQRMMLWLPTWHDARQVLQTLGVESEEVASKLRTRHSIEQERELLDLYDLIAERLADRSTL